MTAFNGMLGVCLAIDIVVLVIMLRWGYKHGFMPWQK